MFIVIFYQALQNKERWGRLANAAWFFSNNLHWTKTAPIVHQIILHPQHSHKRKTSKMKENQQKSSSFTGGCGSSPPWQWDGWSCWPETWESWVCVTSHWVSHWGLLASESWWCQPDGQPWHRWSCLQLGLRGTPQIPERIIMQKDICQVYLTASTSKTYFSSHFVGFVAEYTN